MNELFEYIGADKLKELLKGYSIFFRSPLFLLNHKKELFLSFPQDAAADELKTEPVCYVEELLGYIAMEKDNAAPLSFIKDNMTGIIGLYAELESLSGEIVRNYDELTLLWRLSERLGTGLDAGKICAALADEFMSQCPSSNLIILLASKKTGLKEEPVFTPVLLLGGAGLDKEQKDFDSRDFFISHILEKKQGFIASNVTEDKRFKRLPFPAGDIMVIPLIVEDYVIGALIAGDKLSGEEFYSTELKLFSSAADECAISVKKAFLYDEIKEMLFKTAEAFSFAIDAKDAYTYGHSKRVSETSVILAEKLNCPSQMREWVRLAALLHDIGKIGVPEEILNRAGKLDMEAMEKMKEHSVIGSRMIEHIERFREIADWIRHHHEHYDGSGYPDGLKGEEIPLASRIIAVVDNFDALTTNRPYRSAVSKEAALSIIKDYVGVHFDPVVFECLKRSV